MMEQKSTAYFTHLLLQNLYDATVFFVLTRAAALWGLSSICTTMAGRTRRLLERQAKDSEERQRIETELDVAHRSQHEENRCIIKILPRYYPGTRIVCRIQQNLVPFPEIHPYVNGA